MIRYGIIRQGYNAIEVQLVYLLLPFLWSVRCKLLLLDIHHLTSFIVDPTTILLTGDMVGMGINLSWSQEPQVLDDSALRFLLTISHGSSSDIMSLNLKDP